MGQSPPADAQRSRGLCSKVTARDLTDDRWATILAYLRVTAGGVEVARALNQSVRRVDDLPGRVVRVDTTTAAASGTPEGLFQLGPSKAHRPDRPQVKSAMSVLERLVTVPAVRGREIAGSLGLT